ncbi:MAG TPA: hypothetical protein VFQ54_02150 [Thermomicrobiales bacterium]|nr:hypothetical protein [Thermomicrobiales bacterium]
MDSTQAITEYERLLRLTEEIDGWIEDFIDYQALDPEQEMWRRHWREILDYRDDLTDKIWGIEKQLGIDVEDSRI